MKIQGTLQSTRSRRHTVAITIALASIAAVSGTAISAQIASAANPTPDPTALSLTGKTDSVAVEKAHQERVENFPPAQPIDPTSVWATEQQVVSASKLLSQAPQGKMANLTEEERAAIPAQSVLATYGEVTAAMFEGRGDPDIAVDRPVWVTVVHGLIRNDSAPVGTKDVVHDVYTTIYDAPTGDLIAFGTGADAFADGLSKTSSLTAPASE